jgi:hypothetical protein
MLAGISDGGATPFIVPWCGCVENPRIPGVEPIGNGIPFSDPVLFSDGVGFYQGSGVVWEVNGAHPLRDTTINIVTRVGSIAPRGGEHFTIVHSTAGPRIYRVVAVQEVAAGFAYTLTIRPPLREAVADDVVLDLDNPRCVMQLADPQAMDLTRELRRSGSPSAHFIESFP